MDRSEIKEMQLQKSIAVSFIIFEVPVCFPLGVWGLATMPRRSGFRPRAAN